MSEAAHAVVRETMDAGVWVFGGGLEHPKAIIPGPTERPPTGPYLQAVGGLSVVDASSREEALKWAAKLAVACRCA